MEIRVNRGELLNELAPMQGVVERKTTIPALAHILLTTRGERLHLAATDLDVSLTSWTEGDVVAEGAVAVQAKKLTEIIRALDDEEVHLVEEEPRTLTIKGASSRFKIRGMNPEDFPTLPSVADGLKAQLPFSDLKRMVHKVFFAISADESRFQLNGALVKLKPAGLEMVATDGYRLALVENAGLEGVELPEGSEEDGVLVPRKALQELQRFEGEGEVIYQRGEHHLSFTVGRRELICRILEGTFPDYERVISKSNDKVIAFERRHLADAVRRVALLTGDRARAVRLELGDGELVISAANPDLGEASERLDCEYQGDELRLGMNPDYLTDFLAAAETDQVQLELKDENSQTIGVPVDGPDERYLCVVMPMRV